LGEDASTAAYLAPVDAAEAAQETPHGGSLAAGLAVGGSAAGPGCWWPGGAGVEGPGGARCKLSPVQLRELQAVLEAGPAACGWDEDQCWTLARIGEVVRGRFRVSYTLAGVDLLLHRIGWSVQVPARQAAERDGAAIARWRRRPGRW
jgi:Winged helix-turn helix